MTMKRDKDTSGKSTDVLNVMGPGAGEIDRELDELLERGKSERVMILVGTEGPQRQTQPYARTHVEISFNHEKDLRECVKLLRWSDERLRARPDQFLLWEWTRTYREDMTIYFGVNWYDREFFERRKDAFREPAHARFYTQFGATPNDIKLRHEILSDTQ